MRKKLYAVLLILAASAACLFAISLDAEARGNAVLTSGDVSYAFSHNPAFLASSGFSLELPLTARLFNASGVLSNDLVENISDIASMDEERMVSGILDLLREFSGTMPLLSIEERISLTAFGMGASISASERVITTGGSVGLNLSLALNGTLSAGFAHKFGFEDGWSLSAGAILNLDYMIYTSPAGVETVVGIMLDPDGSGGFSIYSGHAVSADIGVNVTYPLGFSTAFVVRNLGSGYHMNDDEGNSFILPNPVEIDTAAGWSGQWSFFALDLEIGMRGWNRIRSYPDLLESLNAGASLAITKFIDINLGIDGGYPACGVTLDFLCFEIAAAYYWQDFGVVYGLAPRDVLSLEIALSFE